MKFIPLFDRVLIKPIANTAENFGFVLSEIAKDRPDKGEIVAVGEGLDLNYNKCKNFLNVGDKVMFNRFAGADVEIDGEKYIVIRQIDVVGVFDESENNC